MKKIIHFTLVVVLAWSIGHSAYCAESANDEALKAITQANANFMTAFAKGDANTVAEMYTDKARLLPPHAKIMEGRSAIKQFWKATMEAGIKELELKTVEVESFGDTIVEQGDATVFGKDKAVVDQGKYIVVWKRVDGKWKLHRDCWNSNEPAVK